MLFFSPTKNYETLFSRHFLLSVTLLRATPTTNIHQSPGTCCVPPPAALIDTVWALSPHTTAVAYLRVSSSDFYTPMNWQRYNLFFVHGFADSAHRGLSPCPAVTAVMRNPVYTVRSHRVHTSNCPSVASQICHQQTHTRYIYIF